MGRSKSPYAQIEPGLSLASREKIQWNREHNKKKTTVEKIVKKIMNYMKQTSSVFRELYVRTFGAGSSYEGLKADAEGDFDIDILLRIPEETFPEVSEDANHRGYVQMRLRKLEALSPKPELYRAVSNFLDSNNYLSINRLKSTFMQRTFDKARVKYFPNGVIILRGRKFKICKVQHGQLTPAFTLTIEGGGFSVEIDLVPCIILTKKYWPGDPFRKNPYKQPSEFFIVPTPPALYPDLDRCFELSFQMQERLILKHRFWVKPTIRIMKLINRHFGHHISSYAFKTLFLEELIDENNCVLETPSLFKGSFSFCLVSMLEKYLGCLENYTIQYFWYRREDRNLLDNLSREQIETYRKQIKEMLNHIKAKPDSETILSYL